MGNRAVITTEKEDFRIYLHWNGGRDSVEAFLTYCKMKEYQAPECDCYGWARLCQVVGNYFGGALSLGFDVYSRLDTDNWDNGVYIIKDWNIIGRKYEPVNEQQEYELLDMLVSINEAQPVGEQLPKDKIIKFITEKLAP